MSSLGSTSHPGLRVRNSAMAFLTLLLDTQMADVNEIRNHPKSSSCLSLTSKQEENM
jgi:hypothetical protein